MNKIERVAIGVAAVWLALVLAIIGLALASGMAQAAPIAQSGVITGYGGTAQCYVLIDSAPSTPGCLHRASVACVIGPVGYVGGAESYAGPLTYPLAIQLYQRPAQVPNGVLTIPQLPGAAGDTLQVGLNGTLSTWVLSAPFAGQSCAPATGAGPRIDSSALARYCAQHPTVPACRG